MNEDNKEPTTDHDLIIRIDERVCSLTKHFTNHVYHHWLIAVPLLMAVIGLVITLLIK